MRRTRTWTVIIAVALLAGSLAACSGGQDVQQDPEAALSEAIEALADYAGIELVLGIDGDREAIAATADGDLDDAQVDLILDSTVVVRATGESEEDAQAEVLVDLAGERAFELRYLPEQQLYLRLDLEAVGRAVDDPSLAQNLDGAVSAAEQLGLGEVASAIRAGEWVQLTGIEQLAEFAAGASSETEEPSEEEVEDVRERIVAALQRFLDQDVDVAYVGEDEAGERVTATTTQAALADLSDEIAGIASDLSGVDGEQFGLDGAAPEDGDEPVELDFWIRDGRLSQVGFDLGSVADETGDAAPEGTFLLASIDEFDGSVGAPAESTEIDLFSIFGSLFGGGGGDLLGGGAEDGAFDEGLEGDGSDDGLDDGGFETGCIPQEQLDELTGGDPAAEAEIEAAIDAGLIEVC